MSRGQDLRHWVFIVLLVGTLGVHLGEPLTVQALQVEEEQEIPVVRSQFSVQAGAFTYFPVDVDSYLRRGRLAGNAMAAGGSGNDIRVLVLNEQQFERFRQQHVVRTLPFPQADALYDTGKRRSIVLSVPLAEPGRYFLVFDNTFSVISSKNVSADIRLVHGGRDRELEERLRKQAAEREERIGQILGRLVESLQEKERELGTRQVSPPVYVVIENDPALNAAALWTRKLVIINRGTVEFSETSADGDSILAGVLGHELAHIFYRHSFGNESEQAGEAVGAGVAGVLMVHPLVGLIAGALAMDQHRQYDRLQEEEADVLGVQLACAASYDPSGLLVFLSKLNELAPGQGSFLQSHPSPTQRLDHLQAEVNKCGTTHEPVSVGGDASAPMLSFKVEPEYSDEARRANLQGMVTLSIVVQRDGTVQDIKIVKSLGLGLDERAIEAVKQWRFRPGQRNGQPVDVSAIVEVTFRL